MRKCCDGFGSRDRNIRSEPGLSAKLLRIIFDHDWSPFLLILTHFHWLIDLQVQTLDAHPILHRKFWIRPSRKWPQYHSRTHSYLVNWWLILIFLKPGHSIHVKMASGPVAKNSSKVNYFIQSLWLKSTHFGEIFQEKHDIRIFRPVVNPDHEIEKFIHP